MLTIGLDIDEVLADFIYTYIARFGNNESKIITKHCTQILSKDKEFWLNLPKLSDINFIPKLYCSKRINPKNWTKQWLSDNGFPNVPLYQQYCQCASKAPLIKGRIDCFIDDSITNVIDLNLNGIPCLLMNTEFNQDYGPMGRIYSLDYEEIEDVYNMFMYDIFPNYRKLFK